VTYPLPSGSPGGEPDVGRFQQGTPISRWGLGRYLVGRAVAADVSAVLLMLGLLVVAAGICLFFVAPVWVAVLVALVGLAILAVRAIAGAVLRRATGVGRRFGRHEQRMRGLIQATRVDVRAELRRIGLPGRRLTMPLLGLRLVGHRRGDTLRRLAAFDVNRVVPASRLDELHLIVQNLQNGQDPPAG
jgi:hypothetical protein